MLTRRDINRIAIVCFGFCLWWFLNGLLGLYILRFGFGELLDGSIIYPEINEIYKSVFRNLLGMNITAPALNYTLSFSFLLSTSIVLFCVTYVWLKITKKLNLDSVDKLAGTSYWWAIRNIFGTNFIVSFLALTILTIILVEVKSFVFLALALLALLILTPIIILKPDNFNNDSMTNWYRLSWAGWQPLTFAIAIYTVVTLVEFEIFNLRSVHAFIPTISSWYLFETLLSAIAISVFLYRVKFSALHIELKRRFNYRFYVSWILFDIKLLIIALWPLPTFLTVNAGLIYVVPQLSANAQASGKSLNPILHSTVTAANAISQYSYLFEGFLTILILLASGHFLYHYDKIDNPQT